ncbi:6-phosphofructokinase [Basidiobolus meristosporus CBS 931.73]|uniref:ATP-dependent 6-phosphofructokinase n=1 Tax=Basidiobolus meristosporus CBS 931.73 TaxID=1314790 RepID=A0A1Y1ZBI9_9FUNG|nr:6-phosphofructokinase [Basidiobolus meristosporus CBS 931.73]|eukprot:ORY07484.1 6-phosphofructokinase [Basidiobolus meristosporus CBS 931.73]
MTVNGISHITIATSSTELFEASAQFYNSIGFQTIQKEEKALWLQCFGSDSSKELAIRLTLSDKAPEAGHPVNLSDESQAPSVEIALQLISSDIKKMEEALKQGSYTYQKLQSTIEDATSTQYTNLFFHDPLNNLIVVTDKANAISTAALPKKSVAKPSQSETPEVKPLGEKKKRIAVMTSGGDAPGMNAAVRAVIRTGIAYGCDAYAIYEGYEGLVQGGNFIKKMDWSDVGGFLAVGGTIIGTARCMSFKTHEGRLQAAFNLVEKGIDAIIVCGGDGSLTGADVFRAEWPGLIEELISLGRLTKEQADPYKYLTIVGLVGSIDNDMSSTDITIGAYTSLHRICEAVDSISSTASSHQRAFVIEVMGRHCGWLALMAGICTGADWLFLPEKPPSGNWEEEMCSVLQKHREFGKRKSIVIVAEGAVDENLNPIKPDHIKDILTNRLKFDTRVTLLGHVQRGGTPCAYDRYLATLQGVEAVKAVLKATPETPSPMIGMSENKITSGPLMEAVELTHQVGEAINSKDFKKAMDLRDPEFSSLLEIYQSSIKPHPENSQPKSNDSFRFGIMNVGAPAGGMNAATRTAVRLAINNGHTPLGIYNGFSGLANGEVKELSWLSVDGWTTRGGSELGTNRTQPSTDFGMIAYHLQKNNINGLLVVGGFEAYTALLELYQNRDKYPAFCIPIVHIPATISNNCPGTDFSLGCDTSLNAIVDACDCIKQSASSTRRRVFVVEVQGGKCGYLATMAGLAAGANVIYTPETGITLKQLQSDINDFVEQYEEEAKHGILTGKGRVTYTTDVVHDILREECRHVFDTRTAVLGHIQQGGTPTPFDRIRATRLAYRCIEWLEKQALANKSNSATGPAVVVDDAKSVCVIGVRGAKVKFTPVIDLLTETDLVNRRETPQLDAISSISANTAQPGGISAVASPSNDLVSLLTPNFYTAADIGNGDELVEIITNVTEQTGASPEDIINTPSASAGLTVLQYAASRGHSTLVEYLLDAGAEVDAVDREGETALLKAAFHGYLGVVKCLVDHCASVQHTDNDVNAASRGYLNIVSYLVNETHVDPLIQNDFGEKAYDVAAARMEAQICELLDGVEQSIQAASIVNYDTIRHHLTVLVVLYENQNAPQSLLSRPSSKEAIQLPLSSSGSTTEEKWFWLSDWQIDLKHSQISARCWLEQGLGEKETVD